MSAYAALVSLLQILETILHSRRLLIIPNRPQLHSLYEKVIFFLDFLENSSSTHKATRISALETKMREAAYDAEDLIESQVSGISNSESRRLRVLMVISILNFFYSSFILSHRIHVSNPAVMLDRVKIFAFLISILAFAATAVCTISAYGLYLALRARNFSLFDGNEAEETQGLRLVLYDMNFLVKEAIRIKEACVDLDMSAYAALLSLKKILDSILDSSGFPFPVSHNREQLESLHGKVAFLMDFLQNADSVDMESQESGVRIPEAAIRKAAYKAQELIEFQIPAEFILDSDRRSFRRSVKLMLLALLSSVSAVAISTTVHVSVQLVVGWVVIVALGFGALALGTRGAEVILMGVDHHRSEMQENQKLGLVMNDLSSIMEDVKRLKDSCGTLSFFPPAAAVSSSTRKDKNSVVGLEKDMEQIKARLLQDSSKLEVISIVGVRLKTLTTIDVESIDEHERSGALSHKVGGENKNPAPST